MHLARPRAARDGALARDVEPFRSISGAGGPQCVFMRGAVHFGASEGRPGADLIVRRLSDVFFVQVLRAWLEAQPIGGGGWLAAVSDPQIGATLRAIHNNP